MHTSCHCAVLCCVVLRMDTLQPVDRSHQTSMHSKPKRETRRPGGATGTAPIATGRYSYPCPCCTARSTAHYDCAMSTAISGHPYMSVSVLLAAAQSVSHVATGQRPRCRYHLTWLQVPQAVKSYRLVGPKLTSGGGSTSQQQ